jgi:hypothetical protein
MSGDDQVTKVAKVLNKNRDDLVDIFNDTDQAQWDFLFNLFVTKMSADAAKKFGVGNCQEKGELATLYLLDQTPGGVRLALCTRSRTQRRNGVDHGGQRRSRFCNIRARCRH